MSNTGTPFNRAMVTRAVGLGFAVFVAFLVAAGLLWVVGGALGLPTVTRLILGACLGPLLVTVPILIWFFAQPMERRQRLFGVPVMLVPPVEPPDTAD